MHFSGDWTSDKLPKRFAAEERFIAERGSGCRLPQLIEMADIRGDLHSHTTASDGNNSIEEMAEAAKARGYEFLAITDHSKSQVIANGLTAGAVC